MKKHAPPPQSVASPMVSSPEACAALGIAPQTLYAYVSRGLLRAAPDPEDSRRSLYDRRDIEALAARRSRGRSRRAVAASTLDWGEPALTSDITRIADGALYYRGRLAVDLARTESLETVATLLWNEQAAPPPDDVIEIAPGETPLARMMTAAAKDAGAALEGGVDIAPARLLRRLTAQAAGVAPRPGEAAHMAAARGWGADARGAEILRIAFVLCADHELNASTYATRVAASAGATLQAAALAGLATISGPKHGGMIALVLEMMARLEGDRNLRRSIRAIARRGPIPGVAHPLYPQRDPRAEAIIAAAGWPDGWERIAAAIREETGGAPSLDFGLALIERRLALPRGAGLGIFAGGRVAGWIAHALEQRAEGKLIRPRAAPATGA